MKKIRQLAFTIFILAAFSSVAFASIIYPALKFIGFSADGKYLAFEESGEARGAYKDSYFDYATTYYVDVAKNSYALTPTLLKMPEGKMGGTFLPRRDSDYKQQVSLKMRKLGIKSGNTGDFVVAHFLNDWSFVKRSEGESYFIEKGGKNLHPKIMPDYPGCYGKVNTTEIEKIIFTHILDSYQRTDVFFELTLIPTLVKPNEGCPESYKFELTLKNNSLHRETELQILQKDGDILPESRYCSLGYKIERVYVYKNRIAVFLNAFSQELPNLSKLFPNTEIDMNYMVVAGMISDK
jgi:hypothetical protein